MAELDVPKSMAAKPGAGMARKLAVVGGVRILGVCRMVGATP